MREVTTWKRFGMSIVVVLVALSTSAYIGPGVGLGALALLIALGLGVLLLFAGFFWYPIKRLLRSIGDRRSSEEDAAS